MMGHIQTHHHFRYPNCETAILNASVDYVHSCGSWCVTVSILSSSPLKRVSLAVGWQCWSRAEEVGSVRVKSWTG